MEVDEAIELKKRLENDINKLLHDFQQKVGLVPKDIQVVSVGIVLMNGMQSRFVTNVSVTVEL